MPAHIFPGMSNQHGGPTKSRSGIITFAGALFILVGAFNIADGLVAMADPDWFGKDLDLLLVNMGAWGALMFMSGILQVVVGAAVLKRSRGGQIFGMCLAGINAFTHLLFIRHYPAWSLVIMAIDIAIIYVLTVHDDEFND